MATGDGFERGFEICVGLDTIHLRRFDERSDASPGGGPFIVTGKQRILASESQGPDAIFHGIGVDLDASVVEKDLQALPVAVEVGEFLAEAGFGGNARALFSEPNPEGLDQGSGTGLAYLEALLGRGATDLGLDGVELGDAPQSLGGDRGVVAVEDLAQLSPGVRPAQIQGKGRLGGAVKRW